MSAVGASLDEADLEALHLYLLRYAERKVATPDIARELVQETWLAVLEALPRFAGRSSIRTWVISILRRKIADLYRAKRRTEPFDDSAMPDPHAPLFEQILSRERNARVLDAIDALSPREREAVMLCATNERAEVARQMGLSQPCLRVTLCRGRRHLRELTEL